VQSGNTLNKIEAPLRRHSILAGRAICGPSRWSWLLLQLTSSRSSQPRSRRIQALARQGTLPVAVCSRKSLPFPQRCSCTDWHMCLLYTTGWRRTAPERRTLTSGAPLRLKHARIWSNSEWPSRPQITPSPSRSTEHTGSASNAVTMVGSRSLQSWPPRELTRTCLRWRMARQRNPSCLIS
jgi:hypothetical protein